jgi:DNA repair exonuclease SbcCD ATPase subunit
MRLVPFGTFTGLGTVMMAADPHLFPLAAMCGVGAFFTGKRLLDRKGNRRRELWRRARENARELGRVAREDRIAAPQMKRLAALQEGVLESLELLPEEYRPLLDEDVFAIVGEVEGAARLARRRAALRRHLESVDRREISRRIESLERDLAELEEGSPLAGPFESALEGRRGELASCRDILDGISMINAQLEGAESLLSNLRGELLALDSGLSSGSLESGLAQLKTRVAYFRRGLDEVTRSVSTLPAVGRLPTR